MHDIILEGVRSISRAMCCAHHEILFNMDLYSRTKKFSLLVEFYITQDRNTYAKDLSFLQMAAVFLKDSPDKFQ